LWRFLEALQNAAYNAPPFPAGRQFRLDFRGFSNATRCRKLGSAQWHFCCPSTQRGLRAVSVNILAAAARESLRLLAWQAAFVAAFAVVFAIVWGAKVGVSALVGGGIGLIWTVYMAFALFRHSTNHGTRLGASTFLAGWAIKVVLTISLLAIAFRSGRLEPPAVLGGLFGAMVAYWAWLTFRVKHAGSADGK
jgi:F0F1-type ATP synthase assembly protein I